MPKVILVNTAGNASEIERRRGLGEQVLLVEPPVRVNAEASEPSLYCAEVMVFVDPSSTVCFLERIPDAERERLVEKTVCAVGSATVESLRASSVHADMVSFDPSWTSVIREVETYTGGADLNVIVVGGDSVFRREAREAFGLRDSKAWFWPEGSSGWEEDQADARTRALALGGGVESILIGSVIDILAIELALGDVRILAEACEFQTDDEPSRRVLAERGVIASRPAK